MKMINFFALTFLASFLVVFAQESDEANAVLQTKRDLVNAIYEVTPTASHKA
jgi:hypothetical protein